MSKWILFKALGVATSVALVLTSCGNGNSDGAANQDDCTSKVPMEVQTAVALGQTRLEDSLKDASSANYRGRFVSRAGTRLVYCGELNAKNSFGGYNGFRRFIVGPNDPVIMENEAPAFDLAWSGECTDPVFALDK